MNFREHKMLFWLMVLVTFAFTLSLWTGVGSWVLTLPTIKDQLVAMVLFLVTDGCITVGLLVMWPFKKKTKASTPEPSIMSALQAHEVANTALEAYTAEEVKKLDRKVRRAIWEASQAHGYSASFYVDDLDYWGTDHFYSSEVRDTVKRILESEGYTVTNYVAQRRERWKVTW